MSRLVYVKPTNTNSKFWHNPEVKGYQYFPETQKGYPPFWDFNEHKYKFFELEDAEVIKLAKEAKLSYIDGPNIGKVIDTADLKHREDPFFNHPRLLNRIKDDITTYNLNDPVDVLKLATFKMYPMVAHSESSKKRTPGAKWIIVDKEVEQKDIEKEYLDKIAITKYFTPGKDKLSPEKMRAMLIAFNDSSLKMDENTRIETIEAWLYQKAHDNTVVQGLSNKQRFINLASMTNTELGLRTLIDKGVKLGVLRKQGSKYLYAGKEIAPNIDVLTKKLAKADNASLLEAIEDEINFKASESK